MERCRLDFIQLSVSGNVPRQRTRPEQYSPMMGQLPEFTENLGVDQTKYEEKTNSKHFRPHRLEGLPSATSQCWQWGSDKVVGLEDERSRGPCTHIQLLIWKSTLSILYTSWLRDWKNRV